MSRNDPWRGNVPVEELPRIFRFRRVGARFFVSPSNGRGAGTRSQDPAPPDFGGPPRVPKPGLKPRADRTPGDPARAAEVRRRNSLRRRSFGRDRARPSRKDFSERRGELVPTAEPLAEARLVPLLLVVARLSCSEHVEGSRAAKIWPEKGLRLTQSTRDFAARRDPRTMCPPFAAGFERGRLRSPAEAWHRMGPGEGGIREGACEARHGTRLRRRRVRGRALVPSTARSGSNRRRNRGRSSSFEIERRAEKTQTGQI